jgi:hypothetical protein
MRFQDAETTTPREPTLAEKRARQQAQRQEEQREADEKAAAKRKEETKRKVMIGGGVTVGIAALVGAWYLVAKPDDVTATCATPDGKVQSDQYCDENYVNSHGGHMGAGGLMFLPIPGGGFSSYHYNYGGTVSNGRVSGGSSVKPAGANINTRGGKSIQRGGFGVGNKGGSGGFGGKSGGS